MLVCANFHETEHGYSECACFNTCSKSYVVGTFVLEPLRSETRSTVFRSDNRSPTEKPLSRGALLCQRASAGLTQQICAHCNAESTMLDACCHLPVCTHVITILISFCVQSRVTDMYILCTQCRKTCQLTRARRVTVRPAIESQTRLNPHSENRLEMADC